MWPYPCQVVMGPKGGHSLFVFGRKKEDTFRTWYFTPMRYTLRLTSYNLYLKKLRYNLRIFFYNMVMNFMCLRTNQLQISAMYVWSKCSSSNSFHPKTTVSFSNYLCQWLIPYLTHSLSKISLEYLSHLKFLSHLKHPEVVSFLVLSVWDFTQSKSNNNNQRVIMKEQNDHNK